jgi:hypothetical protein
VKTADDVAALADEVLGPGFDVKAAEKRFGPVEHWVGELAPCRSTDPAFLEVILETLGGKLTGVQIKLTTPADLPWPEIEAKIGKPVEGAMASDHWNGPVPYWVEREPPHPPGRLLLQVAQGGGSPPKIAHLQGMTLRRAPEPR